MLHSQTIGDVLVYEENSTKTPFFVITNAGPVIATVKSHLLDIYELKWVFAMHRIYGKDDNRDLDQSLRDSQVQRWARRTTFTNDDRSYERRLVISNVVTLAA